MNTLQVAKLVGVHKDTLLRWLRAGHVLEPGRDRRGWRDWSEDQVQHVLKYARGEVSQTIAIPPNDQAIETLKTLDWDFAEAKTNYLTHGLHPYPAKFIPQIPNALIQELSSVGGVVLDPFCGSGTTLVEALTLKRHAVGVDANPIACLVSRAKTTRLTARDIESLRNLSDPLMSLRARFGSGQQPLFAPSGFQDVRTPDSKQIQFWFVPHVITELSHLKSLCLALPSLPAQTLALAVFSSIIVSVSRQDSDTRYVRRDKNVQPGDTVRRFLRALESAIERAAEFADLVEDRFTCRVFQSSVLERPMVGSVDLVVCSPPYPNAYSYHLYHMTRMLWLDFDPAPFKAIEIGSHRKYSKKGNNGATVETFKSEMKTVFGWLNEVVKRHGYCCFVIGDSILNGRTVSNSELLTGVAREFGFGLDADITRHLQDAKKSFNPKIGKIREEHVLIFKNRGKSRV
ncbi:MAG: MerR family transcriptional regulator [Chloroflexi bacterium]|nr:MerR family transcriptional regulator [Chloroflexota bacterium]